MAVDSALKRKSATHNMKPGLSGGFPGMTVKERRQSSVWSYAGIGIAIIGCLRMILSSKQPSIAFGSKQPSIAFNSKAPTIMVDGKQPTIEFDSKRPFITFEETIC